MDNRVTTLALLPNTHHTSKLNISSPPTAPYSKLAIILQGFLGIDGDKGEKGRPGRTGPIGMDVSGLDHLCECQHTYVYYLWL